MNPEKVISSSVLFAFTYRWINCVATELRQYTSKIDAVAVKKERKKKGQICV